MDSENGQNEVKKSHNSCVEEHKNKCLPVVEADASVDPGTQ